MGWAPKALVGWAPKALAPVGQPSKRAPLGPNLSASGAQPASTFGPRARAPPGPARDAFGAPEPSAHHAHYPPPSHIWKLLGKFCWWRMPPAGGVAKTFARHLRRGVTVGCLTRFGKTLTGTWELAEHLSNVRAKVTKYWHDQNKIKGLPLCLRG